ncbi:hypothetical protein ACL02O_05135 [Micromonospora sp. MS34]|uniref:hypothetical protein n=1 Tax=Micromonospora sp. MS34 TaxID=3385971 RepID=UPI0039A2B6C3
MVAGAPVLPAYRRPPGQLVATGIQHLRRPSAGKPRRPQQDLSRKQRGSNNRKKAVVKVAEAHAKVADSRRD